MALTMPFGDVYRGKRVLVTGHTGFKGSWLAYWLRELGADVAGIALDPDTTPSHWPLLSLNGVVDHRIDLADAGAVSAAVAEFEPEFVFHLAAQALVRRSYERPVATFATNVMGLMNLLEAVRASPTVRVLINATTDKVYEPQATQGYKEEDRLGGHDPYSTSKACAELVTESYRRSYFSGDDIAGNVRVATARAGNVIGGGDWAEDRLVPDLVRAAAEGRPIALRHPESIRPWQHVLEPLSGYLRLGQKLYESERYAGPWNFGPGPAGELTVAAIVARLSGHWPELTTTLEPQPGPHEAATLRLDCAKAAGQLQWRPVWTPDIALDRTAAWYRQFHDRQHLRTREDLQAYLGDAHAAKLAWAE